jgi:hypothetical protein
VRVFRKGTITVLALEMENFLEKISYNIWIEDWCMGIGSPD